MRVQKSAQKLESKLRHAEKTKSELEALMSEPDFYTKTSGEIIALKTTELSKISATIEGLEEEWFSLQTLIEAYL